MACLLLRFDAPLMSFGGVVVDQVNPVIAFPGRSMIAGLLANALGWDHRESVKTQALQDGLRHAARWDCEPVRLVDYHTVDLGLDAMRDTGWTTRGRREDRGSGEANTGTHQRWRHYWANGCATVAVALAAPTASDAAALPDLDRIEQALRAPARPLFIGRKTCMPATPILLRRSASIDLRAALSAEPLAAPFGRRSPERVRACWPADDTQADSDTIELDDLRDWVSNVHVGRLRYCVGYLEIAE